VYVLRSTHVKTSADHGVNN